MAASSSTWSSSSRVASASKLIAGDLRRSDVRDPDLPKPGLSPRRALRELGRIRATTICAGERRARCFYDGHAHPFLSSGQGVARSKPGRRLLRRSTAGTAVRFTPPDRWAPVGVYVVLRLDRTCVNPTLASSPAKAGADDRSEHRLLAGGWWVSPSDIIPAGYRAVGGASGNRVWVAAQGTRDRTRTVARTSAEAP